MQHALVAAHQRVVAQHRGNGHGQAQRRHDERLANRACHLVYGGLAGRAYGQQRVVNTPDRAEEADKGRRGAHGGKNGQAGLQLGREFVYGVAQCARDPVADIQRIMQMGLGVAVVQRGFAAFKHQLAERVGGVAAKFGQARGKVFAVPEVFGAFCNLFVLDQVKRLDDDDHPRRERHDQQQQCDGFGDDIALGPDIGKAELGIHESILHSAKNIRKLFKNYSRTQLMGTLNHMASGTPPRLPGT